MFRRLLRALLVIAACAVVPVAGAAAPMLADCPASSISLGGAIFASTTAATFDTMNVVGEASWDLAAGRVFMRSYGWLGGVVVDVFDDFDVVGVPPGTPVNVIAQLTVDGAVWTDGCGGSGCSGMYQVDFVHGSDSRQVLHSDHLFSGRLDHQDIVELSFTITAGQPERLEIKALGHRNPGGSHYSEANCRLAFTPVGQMVVITSCQGFAGGPVPSRPGTWGRLKTLYR